MREAHSASMKNGREVMSFNDEPSPQVILMNGKFLLDQVQFLITWGYVLVMLGHVTVGPCGSMVLYVPKSIFITVSNYEMMRKVNYDHIM